MILTLKDLLGILTSTAHRYDYDPADTDVLICIDGKEYPVEWVRLKSRSSNRCIYTNCQDVGDEK